MIRTRRTTSLATLDVYCKTMLVVLAATTMYRNLRRKRYYYCSPFAYPSLSHRMTEPSARRRSYTSTTNSKNIGLPSTGSAINSNGGLTGSESFFLRQVELTINKVLGDYCGIVCEDGRQQHQHQGLQQINDGTVSTVTIIEDIPVERRETVSIARHLKRRLTSLYKNNDCPRCWMQRKHCICSQCPPVMIETNNDDVQLNRIFVVVHHKEIGLKVDTAKLILSSFPNLCRFVVGGIGPEYQTTMHEMLESLNDPTIETLILFPDDSAKTLADIVSSWSYPGGSRSSLIHDSDDGYDECNNQPTNRKFDLIVLDGTWAQARKFHSRYFGPKSLSSSRSSSPDAGVGRETSVYNNVRLSDDTLDQLTRSNTHSGHQLRRHDIAWRQVGTFDATLLFLEDLERLVVRDRNQGSLDSGFGLDRQTSTIRDAIGSYQEIANEAARREMGPPRMKQ